MEIETKEVELKEWGVTVGYREGISDYWMGVVHDAISRCPQIARELYSSKRGGKDIPEIYLTGYNHQKAFMENTGLISREAYDLLKKVIGTRNGEFRPHIYPYFNTPGRLGEKDMMVDGIVCVGSFDECLEQEKIPTIVLYTYNWAVIYFCMSDKVVSDYIAAISDIPRSITGNPHEGLVWAVTSRLIDNGMYMSTMERDIADMFILEMSGKDIPTHNCSECKCKLSRVSILSRSGRCIVCNEVPSHIYSIQRGTTELLEALNGG